MKTLYLTDLDGTLLRSDERVSEYTMDVINRFVQNGGYFSYATARSIVSASKATAGLAVEFPAICYNGAFIIGNKSNEVLRSNYFSQEEITIVREVLTEHKVFPIIYAHINAEERFSYMEHHINDGMRSYLDSRLGDLRRRIAANIDNLYFGDIFYFSCIDDESKLAPIRDIFMPDGRFQCLYQKDIYSNAQWCEILPQSATKANAALQLKETLNCDKLVVFGDGLNDMSLFSVADESYAMSNAVPELKEIATGVIGSNNGDGVAKWIEENVLY